MEFIAFKIETLNLIEMAKQIAERAETFDDLEELRNQLNLGYIEVTFNSKRDGSNKISRIK